MKALLLYSTPVVPATHFLIMAMIGMLSALLVLMIFILVYLLQKRNLEKKYQQWSVEHHALIHNAIYWEPPAGAVHPNAAGLAQPAASVATDADPSPSDVSALIPIPPETVTPLQLKAFRQQIITGLLSGKKSLSGSAATNLILLYNQLGLEKDSSHKLASRRWHIQAQGIQELALMEQRQFEPQIYRLTNTKNEVVRKEAQSALVQLYGFEGLRFLDITDQPLSEWHQIQLLRLLSRMPGSPPDKVRLWLQSSNETVRLFSLRLITEHHQQECCPQVEQALHDESPAVRLQAIRCLREIYEPSTPDMLMAIYPHQDLTARIAILDTLGHIGSDEQIDFIEQQLTEDANKAKLEAARALVRIGTAGKLRINNFPMTDQYPWTEIIKQALTEKIV